MEEVDILVLFLIMVEIESFSFQGGIYCGMAANCFF